MKRVAFALISLALFGGVVRADDPNDGQWPLHISSTAGGRVTTPGEGAFAYDSGEFVRLEAEAEPGFVFVGWSGTYATGQNPTYLFMDQNHTIRAHFISTLDVIRVDGAAPGDPRPEDATVSDPRENGTAEHPFDGIQEAIDVAADGVSIIVRPGTYYENIDFTGKSIHLLGIDPETPGNAAYPVIDGAGAGPVVTFSGGEDPNCLLMGFVLTRGAGWQGGAIVCSQSSPTVRNCLIVGNHASGLNAAAVYCTDSDALFANCTIADNSSSGLGGGLCLFRSNVAIVNSILWGNAPGEILLDSTSELSIRYSDVTDGWPGTGNLAEDPLFARRGYWIDPSNPAGAARPGAPGVVWMDGDYHLLSQAGRWNPQTQRWVEDEATSVGIDTGDPASQAEHEPAGNGSVINMGAYGGTAQASKFDLENIRWNQPVSFADPRLKQLVEAELWVWNPTPMDMLGLISLSAHFEGITDLTGLEYAENLQSLDLALNEIDDISPLFRLTNLQSLVLNNNYIRSLAPVVRLTQLEHLDMHENQLADLSPLSRLKRMKELIVYENQIGDVGVLSELTHLRALDLLANQITDISPLTTLTSLKVLDLRNNPLDQEAFDVHIPQIVANNPGIDVKHDLLVPRQLSLSSTSGGSVIQPGEGTYIYEDGEIVRLEAQAEPGFVFAGWSGTYATSANPSYITMDRNHTVRANFVESGSGQ